VAGCRSIVRCRRRRDRRLEPAHQWHAFIMITLAFAQMLYYFFVSLEAYGGDDGISLFARNTFPGMI
jgi:hypothetical protein